MKHRPACWIKHVLVILGALLLAACTTSPVLETIEPGEEAAAPPTFTVEVISSPPGPTSSPKATFPAYQSPDWFDSAVVYEIFVRSFADSDRDGVGDLQGIQYKLDYLEDLHIDAIWLMPIYPSPSVHGYDVTDYRAVNPDYGTVDDLWDLVEGAHQRGMRVIIDFVPSHLSKQHPFFTDALGNPSSPYSDWFVWTNDEHTAYAGFAGNEEMPRFNHYNPEVVDYLVESALFWMDLDGDGDYHDGVDGFRIDNATFPPIEFFEEFRRETKAVNPDLILLGEAWVEDVFSLSMYYENRFDALFDFPLYSRMQGNHNFNADGILAGESFPTLLTALFKEEADKFPAEALSVRFLSNHDTNRIANEVNNDPGRIALAPAFLAALPGPVMVYYGEEIGMPGQKGGPPGWDSYRREPMDWYADLEGEGQTTWFTPPDRWNQAADGISVEEQLDQPDSLLTRYQKVFKLRRDLPVLREGTFEVLELSSSGGGVWGFARVLDGEIVFVLINFSQDTRSITIPQEIGQYSELFDLLSGESLTPGLVGQELIIEPADALWLWTQPAE